MMQAKWIRFPQAGVVAIACIFAAAYFMTAVPRLLYPYDLDFIEDSMLMQSLRVAQGQPIYLPPNADFNPHVYMPLFFWLGGALLKLTGPSLPVMRLISLGATLATTGLIYWIARRESGRLWLAVASAGLFLGGYALNGFWYELARVDSLFVALTLGGLAIAIYAGESRRRLVAAGFVLALAALTKQTGFIVAGGIAIFLLTTTGRRAWAFILSFSGLTIITLLILNLTTDGWFFYHVFHIGSADPVELSRLIHFFSTEVFGVMAGLSAMAALATILGARQAGWKVWREQAWLVGIALALLVSAMGRMRVGGNLNNRMPAYAFLCLAPALLMKLLTPEGFGMPRPSYASRVRWRDALIYLLILMQFALGRYSLPRHIPTSAMRLGGDRLVQRIASIHGNVLVLMHPYYALLAGKQPSTQIATLWYVRERGALPLPDDFVQRVESLYYSAIISDDSSFEKMPDLQALLTANYPRYELLSSSESPPTLTGVTVRPRVIYFPNP
ncbi:MAG TPA: glycosyltransferase family 39 protein [Anaerolineales bacterium]|jgi:hypothetical protein